jgi:hypothetical protein
MASAAVLAHRPKVGAGVVRPNIGRLHAFVTVSAVCNRISRQSFHKAHFPQTAARVLYKPKRRAQFMYQPEHILVYAVAENSIRAFGK